MKKKDQLTTVEIYHLLTLLKKNKEDGDYFGNKEQYWIRTDNIIRKLQLLYLSCCNKPRKSGLIE